MIMPAAYPYARVTALCDNANLAAQRASVDKRVVRWKQGMEHAGGDATSMDLEHNRGLWIKECGGR